MARIRTCRPDPIRVYLGLNCPGPSSDADSRRVDNDSTHALAPEGEPIDLTLLTNEELATVSTILRVACRRAELVRAFATPRDVPDAG